MTHRRLALLLLLVSLGCQKPATSPARTTGGPQVRATVITIRTSLAPEGTSQLHTIVVAGDRARSTQEHDLWRLFQFDQERVVLVDDIGKTVRERTLAEMRQEKGRALASNLPPHYPRLELVATDERRVILGVEARKHVIESGTYRRELWIAEHRAIPPSLFAMMVATSPATTPLAPMMRGVEEALAQVRGFPLVDRTEVTWGDTRKVIERTVVGIEQKDVPESLIRPPADYRNLTPVAKRK